jgi:hypothetical protein
MQIVLQAALVVFGIVEMFAPAFRTSGELDNLILGVVPGLLARAPLMIWVYVAYRRLPTVGATNLRFRPGSAVLSFFIPIASWVLPLFVVRELWRATGPRSVDPAKPEKLPGLVIAWFVIWIVGSALGAIPGAGIPFLIERLAFCGMLMGRIEARRRELSRRQAVLAA